MTILEFFDRVYAPLRLPIGAASTRKKYRGVIALLRSILGREPLLSDLSDDLVAAACNAVLLKGRSPATANGVRGKLHALWTLAAKRQLVSSHPTMPRIPEYKRAPTAWNRDQLAALWGSLSQEPGKIAGIPAATWWLNVHGVLWDSGARIGVVVAIQKGKPKLTGLEWQHTDLIGRTVLYPAEHQKQRADQRFALHADTAAALKLQLPRDRRWVFPWPWCEATLYNRYSAILERAGLPTSRRDKFHRMRRSVASWYEAAGGNATALLGHSARKVTENYLDALIVGDKRACDVLFRPTG